MLELEFVNEHQRLVKMYLAAERESAPFGVNVFLTDDGVDAGFARVILEDGARLDDFAVLPAFDCFGNRDFFFRALLYKLLQTCPKVRVSTPDSRLEKFGFLPDGAGASVTPEGVLFPSSCGDCHDD